MNKHVAIVGNCETGVSSSLKYVNNLDVIVIDEKSMLDLDDKNIELIEVDSNLIYRKINKKKHNWKKKNFYD